MRTFAEAIPEAHSKCGAVSVLLGNGFSIDYAPAVFSYGSLVREATFPRLSITKEELFETLSSQDFEVVVDKLHAAADLQSLYGGRASVARALRQDARIVRNGLATAVSRRHPDCANALSDEEVAHARRFLANFTQVYTLNYDLLLYWAVNRTQVAPPTPMRDGFGRHGSASQGPLVWNARSTDQEIFYLHGALHLYAQRLRDDRRRHVVKVSTPGRLMPELRRRLDAAQNPLIITEGSRAEKESRIERSAYLRSAHRRFARVEGALFIHGASLGQNDDHLWDAIAQPDSRVRRLYVGVHSPGSAEALTVAERARAIVARRAASGGKRLRLRFYDAASAAVWRDT